MYVRTYVPVYLTYVVQDQCSQAELCVKNLERGATAPSQRLDGRVSFLVFDCCTFDDTCVVWWATLAVESHTLLGAMTNNLASDRQQDIVMSHIFCSCLSLATCFLP
jgi:uncharacterized protein YuzB (UPF0349 family)